jgi:hypothetical protein
MNNIESGMVILGAVVIGDVTICAIYLTRAIEDLRRTIAKLPEALPKQKEIVISPREEARSGDVTFHIPSVLYGDRS